MYSTQRVIHRGEVGRALRRVAQPKTEGERSLARRRKRELAENVLRRFQFARPEFSVFEFGVSGSIAVTTYPSGIQGNALRCVVPAMLLETPDSITERSRRAN